MIEMLEELATELEASIHAAISSGTGDIYACKKTVSQSKMQLFTTGKLTMLQNAGG